MPAGFQSFYAEGMVQTTNDFRAFSLIKSGTLYNASFRTTNTTSDSQGISFALLSAPELPYKRSGLLVFIKNYSDTDRVAVLYGQDAVLVYKWHNIALSSRGIDYYMFAQVERPQGNSGFQLWDGKGSRLENLMLDSSWHLLVINKMVEIPANQPPLIISSATNGTYKTSGLGVLSTEAYCIPSPRSVMYGPSSIEVRLFEGAWISEGEIKVNWIAQDGTGYAGMRYTGYTNSASKGMILTCATAHLPIPYTLT